MARTINQLDAIMVVEDCEAEPLEYYANLQALINDGAAWRLQGFFGRTMAAAIEDGHCLLGTASQRDTYGNRIPARHEIVAGAAGTIEYVAAKQSSDWASAMANIA